MRTLDEVIEAVKDNEPVEDLELRFAVLALDALAFMARRLIQNLDGTPEAAEGAKLDTIADYDTLMHAPLDEHVQDPSEPSYQAVRKLVRQLVDAGT